MANLPKTVNKASQVVMARADGPEFTALDRKVFNVLFANAYQNIISRPHDRMHAMKLRDLAVAVGEDASDLRRIKESLLRLWSVKISIDYIDEEHIENTLRCHYLSYRVSSIAGAEVIYAFDEILLAFLHFNQVFSIIELAVSNRMKSQYGLRLYEVMQLKYNMRNPRWSLTIEELRAHFELGDQKYLRIDHLRHKVIDKAIEDVNENAPFQVSVEYDRVGRGGAISGATFLVFPKRTDDFTLMSDKALGKPKRDVYTVDMFEDMNEAEKALPPTLEQDTIEEATRMLDPGEEVLEYRDRWFNEHKASCHIKPNEKFLAWVRIQKSQRSETTMSDIDVDGLMAGILKDA